MINPSSEIDSITFQIAVSFSSMNGEEYFSWGKYTLFQNSDAPTAALCGEEIEAQSATHELDDIRGLEFMGFQRLFKIEEIAVSPLVQDIVPASGMPLY